MSVTIKVNGVAEKDAKDKEKIMKFDIIPYVSAGPIKIGMHREAVHQVLRSNNISTPQEELDANTEGFESIGLQVEYENDLCIAVIMTDPAICTWKDRHFLSHPQSSNFEWPKSLDKDATWIDADITSIINGITLYADTKKTDKESPTEAIMIFRYHYFFDEY